MLFVALIAICYLMYVQDINVFKGLVTQQEKLAKSFYIIISEYFKEPEGLVTIVNKTLLMAFTIIYFFFCITLFYNGILIFINYKFSTLVHYVAISVPNVAKSR